jgi:hypothetical protein
MKFSSLTHSVKNQSGSVAVITALCMTVLVGMLAFVLNTGFLYEEKNRYQNAVEAAAMAGALRLCDGDPEGTAETVLYENFFSGSDGGGFPEGYTVEIVEGYYDAYGYYDFSGYSGYVSFVEEADMPADVYVNSVLVQLTVDKDTVLPGLVGKEEVGLRTAAVGYLKRYGMLSLGEEPGDGITFTNFSDNEPEITGGSIHANNDIAFDASPDIDTTSIKVTAGGSISGYDGGTSGVNSIFLKPVSVYLEELYAQADKIITEDDFPAPGRDNIIEDEFYNTYYRTDNGNRLIFSPHTGDHGGMIYYFSGDGDVQLGNINYLGGGNDPEEEITNLTFAADRSIRWSVGGNDAWGGENENQVTIIAGEDIDFGGMAISDATFEPRGVVFLAGGDIRWRNAAGMHNITYGIRNLRMIAEGSIEIEGPGSWWHFEAAFNLAFGPPCPPSVVRLGRLVTP